MPRFFIDTSDEDLFVRDDEGCELPDVEAAKAEAIRALPDMASDVLPDGDQRTFLATVRGQNGQVLLHASLVLSITSMISNAHR